MLWLAGIAAALLALLAVPVDIAFAARRRERLEARLTVGWLWGVVSVPVSSGEPEKCRRKKPPKHPRRKRRKKTSGARRAWAAMRSEAFVRRLLRLPGDLLRRVHIRRLELDVRLGLDDPADTGRLWGLVGPAAALLPVPDGATVAVVPEFSEALFHLDARAEARMVPATVLGVLLTFLLSPATLRAARAAIRGAP